MLIIGLGNPDRGDDAAGLLVARGLMEHGIDAIQHRGGTLDLIEIWQSADCALIVDAVLSGADLAHSTSGTHGLLNCGMTYFGSSTHALGLADAIELARALDRLPKNLTIYGIEAAHFVVGTPPPSQVLAGIERAFEYIASRPASSLENLSL